MKSTKWKLLIVSVIVYQALLTWCLFSLVNTSAYFSSTNCGSTCYDHLFGYILQNQGAADTTQWFLAAGVVLVLVNIAAWAIEAVSRARGRRADEAPSGSGE